MGFCYLPHDRVKLAVNNKKKQTAGSKWARSQNGPRVKMGFCYLPPERVKMGQRSLWAAVVYPDRVKLTVNSKKETNSRVKMGKGSRWASVIYPLKESKWGCCCLPPDRVKLIVNSKKETNSRVKMSKESKWASAIYPLKESKWGKGHYGLLLFTP